MPFGRNLWKARSVFQLTPIFKTSTFPKTIEFPPYFKSFSEKLQAKVYLDDPVSSSAVAKGPLWGEACNWWNVNTPQYPLHTTWHLIYPRAENGTNLWYFSEKTNRNSCRYDFEIVSFIKNCKMENRPSTGSTMHTVPKPNSTRTFRYWPVLFKLSFHIYISVISTSSPSPLGKTLATKTDEFSEMF